MKVLRIGALLMAVVAAMMVSFTPALASERISGGDFTVDEDVDDDLYLSGQNVIVESTINGDLIFTGKSLTLNGTVTGDLIFGGQWLQINGTVEDDVRAGGMTIIIGADGVVGDDLNVGAYAFEMRSGATVGGDAYTGTAQAVVTNVGGSVFASGNQLRIDGVVGGDVAAAVGDEESAGAVMNPAQFMNDPSIPVVSQLPPGLSFGSDGRVEGNVNYAANSSAVIPDGVVDGEVRHSMQSAAVDPNAAAEEEAADAGVPDGAKYIGYVLGSFIMLLVVGVLMQRLVPNLLVGTIDTLRVRTAASFGAGLVAFAAFYVIAPLLIVLGLGLLLAPLAQAQIRLSGGLTLLGVAAITAFNFMANWVAPIVVALIVGGWITRRLGKESVPNPTATLAVGLAIVVVMMAIPFVGRVLIAGLIGVMGLGAMVLYLWPRRPVMVDPAKTPPPVGTIVMDRPRV